MSWRIENNFISPDSIPDNGNRLLVGNGYLGIRGTLEEAGKAQLAAINLAGIYDRVGDGVYRTTFAGGATVTVNYGDRAVTVDGEPLSARSFTVRNGQEG